MDQIAPPRLKMADVARLAGVSVATVSRALAGSPLVSDETRARIEAAVQATGYVVNQVASGLVRKPAAPKATTMHRRNLVHAQATSG